MAPELVDLFTPEPNTGCFIPVHAGRGTGGFPGYATIPRLGPAHRVALEIKLGRPLRRGRIACHTCLNKWCGNPAHLYEGTYSQNSSDAHRPKQIRRLQARLDRLLADERAKFARAAGEYQRPAKGPKQRRSDVLDHGRTLRPRRGPATN